MSYTINLSNGTQLVQISDGTVDTAHSSISLFGKNYSGYGALLNADLVHILESFAFDTAPANPLKGQLWWDSGTNLLKIYTTLGWKVISGPTPATISPTATNIAGDLWWDSINGQLKVYNGSTWIVIGPAYSTAQGQSGNIVATIVDTSSFTHTVVEVYSGTTLVGVISADPTFTVNSLTGFTTISPGFNLASSMQYNGNASNALKLGGISSANFLRSDTTSTTFYPLRVQNNTGLTVGLANDFTVGVSGGNVNVTNNTLSSNLDFYVAPTAVPVKALSISPTIATSNGSTGSVLLSGDPTVALGAATKNYVDSQLAIVGAGFLKADGTTPVGGSLIPGTNEAYSLGANPSLRYSVVYANAFQGSSVAVDLVESGIVTISGTPTNPTDAATVQTVTDSASTLTSNYNSAISAATTALINGASLSTLDLLSGAVNNSATFGSDIVSQLGNKAPINNPTFTGTVSAPTPTVSDNTTKVATTQFVNLAITDAITAITELPNTIDFANALTTSHTIGGVSFNGTADITVQTAINGFTVSGGKLNTPASNTAYASLKITPGVAPTSPVNGDVWVDSVTGYIRVGGASRALWHNGNLSNVSTLVNDAGYITAAGSCDHSNTAALATTATTATLATTALVTDTATSSSFNVMFNSGNSLYSHTNFTVNPSSGAVTCGPLLVNGTINATGDVVAYYSDDRLKTRLGGIEHALDKICSLTGFFYQANETAVALGFEVKREVGISAQETRMVLPEAVVPAPAHPDYLTVKYDRLIPVLIEAIKDLKKEIDDIKSRL